MRAVVPGSFDPVTHGHLDVVARAAELFDEVVVAVGANTSKTALFTPEERVGMLTEALAGRRGTSVTLFSGLLVDFCAQQGAGVVVKGVRRAADVDHELPQAQLNAQLGDLETVWLPTAAVWAPVSSTLVREIARLGGDITPFVPAAVAERVRARLAG